MKVSVPIIAYNQEQYLARALDSILMQEVNFDYEIIIGEDASTDGTADVALEYQRKDPKRIQVLLQDRTTAEAQRRAGLGGKLNFISSLQACRGQYVALLDGDDYWTDTHKLQKQSDFLEENPKYVMCCHNVAMFHEDGSQPTFNFLPPNQKERSTIADLLDGNFIHSCSVMFRNHLVKEFPGWYYTSLVGDWPLYVMLAQHGDIHYFSEVMANYRVHESAFWSSRNSNEHYLHGIQLLEHFNHYLDHKYEKTIRCTQLKYWNQLITVSLREQDIGQAKTWLGLWRKLEKANHYFPSTHFLSKLLEVYTPAVYRFVKSLKHATVFT